MLEDDTLDVNNFVPNPLDPKEFLKIKRVVEEDQLIENVHTTVYKNGVGSGLTKGELIGIDIRTFVFKMMDNKNYVFGDLMLIESREDNNEYFTRRGDSGALIYNASGEALGIVIGGDGKYTFAHPIDRCLKKEGAKLK